MGNIALAAGQDVGSSEPAVLDVFRQYRRTKDVRLYHRLVCQYLPLVRKIARRYVRQSVSLDDLIQVGAIGLMTAVNTFDPARNVKFETYAYHHVAGEIRHYLRDDADLMRTPRWARKAYGEMKTAAAGLQQELGRSATLPEIAQRMRVSEEELREVLRAYGATRVERINDEGGAGDAPPQPRQRYASFQLPIEDRVMLLQAIERLAEVQRKAIYYLFYLDLTQSETAKLMGISQRHVSRLLAAALKRLAPLVQTVGADGA
ncbi:MAG TPA: sigma-70 family RNA polymerase sigma factor [bacterium]|nr:sigma-70 family RNA polymerase sigma factor [bacterium]